MSGDPSQHARAAMAQRQIVIGLMRVNPDLTDAEIAALADAALESGAARSYALGAEPRFAVADAIAAAEASEVGQMIRAHRARQSPTNTDDTDHAAAVAGMSPLQMIQYARSRGLR